eukprot:scaffold4024_cov128-Isochrysis_galbana.AAC.2
MTDPPTDDTEAREQDAPDTTDAKRQTPRTSPRPHRSRASRQGTLRHAEGAALVSVRQVSHPRFSPSPFFL